MTTTLKDDYTDTSALPPVLDVPDAAKLLGIGRTLAYELIRTGQWPTPTLRIGRLIKIPTQPLLDLLRHGAACAVPANEPVGPSTVASAPAARQPRPNWP